MVITGKTDREAMSTRIMEDYFAAMDRGDVERTVGCFGPGATLTCETNAMHLTGADDLAAFFTKITANTYEMVHEVTNLVVDSEARKCAAELRYRNRRRVGADIDTAVVNVFDFGPDCRFTRVRFWTADVIVPAAPAEVAP